MKASEIQPGDHFSYEGKVIRAYAVIREEDDDISEVTRNFVKGHVLITFGGRYKTLIPKDSEVGLIARKE